MKHEEISLNTKKALANALKKAMKTKPFQKITVSELIKDCNINRKTFYYHFSDIYELLKWMFEQEAIEVVKQFDFMVDHEEAINFIMDYVEENDYIISCAYDSIGRDELKRFFYADFLEIENSIIEQAEKLADRKLESGYKEFISNFYMEAITGTMIQWVKERDRRDRKTVVKYIEDTIRNSLMGILLADKPEDNYGAKGNRKG